MIKRCGSDSNRLHHRYKARGIAVCDRWLTFRNFLLDMGLKPDGMQIDRIDNNSGYSPENCRWATSRENNNNRCNNKIIEFAGVRKTSAEWAREKGLQPRMLVIRLGRGWSVERALNQIPRGRKDADMENA